MFHFMHTPALSLININLEFESRIYCEIIYAGRHRKIWSNESIIHTFRHDKITPRATNLFYTRSSINQKKNFLIIEYE